MKSGLQPPIKEVELQPEEASARLDAAVKESAAYTVADIEREMLLQKRKLRPWLFYILLVVIVAFYALALIAVVQVLYLSWQIDVKALQLPQGLILLVATLCAPPTLLVTVALRSVFEHKQDKSMDSKPEDLSPYAKLLAEILKTNK